ncbi:MAG TPA: inositol monophosphatase family protein [Acidimicrobiales bacterium]
MCARPAPAPDADPRDLAALAADVAARAGDLLLEGWHRRRRFVATKSTGTDMVSEMDHASERLIVSALLADRPDDGVVGEEGTARPGTSGVRWVVDPLDGTTNYLYGIPGWAVSIAAEAAGGEPGRGVIAGAVLDPAHGELFLATQGGGATCNGAAIACSDQDRLDLALLATGFGYDPVRRRAQAKVLAGLIGEVRDIRRHGAAAVDLCSVACGRVDGYYERGLAWWDHAAGALVATEAGAVVSSLDGGPPHEGSIVAAAPGIAVPLRDRLSALGANAVP